MLRAELFIDLKILRCLSCRYTMIHLEVNKKELLVKLGSVEK